jgi:Zn-finger nucleic acid-binding protein
LWVPGNHFNELIQKAVDAYRERVQDPFLAPNLSTRKQKKSAFSSKIVYRKCPVCSSTMSRRNFARKSGIIIDRCRQHGTWLDADELEDIATFVAQGGMRNTTVTVQQNVQSPLDEGQIQALLEKGRAGSSVEERTETVDRAGRKFVKRTVITHQHGPWGRIASLADFLSDLLD